MAHKLTVLVACAVAFVAVAAAAAQLKEASESKIALDKVPVAAKKGAQGQLTGIGGAEKVTLKNGRTVYEMKGKNKAGKIVELYVDEFGKVLGTEGPEHDKD